MERMKYATFLIAITASLLVSGTSSKSQRVSNGAQANSGDFPYVVSVTINNGQHICGGFIYSKDWVVTAASCVYEKLPSQVSVTVGEVSLINDDPGEVDHPIFQIVVFEGYDYSSKLHDIALLQTASPITFGTNVNFIRYEEASEATTDTGVFAGWGATFEGGAPASRLRSTSVTFGSDCLDYGADQFYNRYMICAGGSAVDAGSPCQFDEGSPLVQDVNGEWKVVGIMSKNAGCGTGFKPTIYTRLVEYYPWFEKFAGPQPVPE